MNKNSFSIAKHMEKALDIIMGKSGIMLLGLTGGIASGKSTVANMLRDMGFLGIDFDIIARQVVEPGKPAWKYIVDYFGETILRGDRTIDRKRLSGIVFQDENKRKILESFIYPSMADEFILQVERIAADKPGAVIQAVVPLLIEGHMQSLFNRIIVVYIPREKQIERLMERDGISRSKAQDILNAQMPIDEKIKYADFVINNENSLEETKAQVEDLYKRIKDLQNIFFC